ncbi:MAG TPA: FeoA family protein [Verrucomicrobiae bacterium]|nr:FeoA family protein [Verrucomicrobiae bacterium]
MKTAAPQMLHCPLCGFEFERADTPCNHGCPLGRFCKLVCCPNCRYEFPRAPQGISWIHKLVHYGRKPAADRELLGLHELEEGEHSELVCLNCSQASRRNSLAVYGLTPGSHLILLQKRPTYVVRIGETELAIESSIASDIVVRRRNGADPERK